MEIGCRLFSFNCVRNSVTRRKLVEEKKKGCTICMFLSKELFKFIWLTENYNILQLGIKLFSPFLYSRYKRIEIL